MRKALLSLLLFFAAPSVWATNAVYISQSGAGLQDGTSCANAKPASYFNASGNWNGSPTGIQIGPDTTVHFCGTFTGTANSTALTFQGSGTSGHPVILHGENGNLLQAPYWSLNGAVSSNAQNYLTIETLNIQNTANGPGLANAAGSYGVFVSGSHDVTVQNNTIGPICLHVSGQSTQCSTSGVTTSAIYAKGGNNIVITGNTVHDALWNIFVAYSGSQTGLVISNNASYNGDHLIAVGDTSCGQTLTGAKIFGNDLHDMANWDGSAGFHHDFIHVWTGAPCTSPFSTVTGLQIYNNYLHGDPGATVTAFINLENNSGNTYTLAVLYNNIFVNGSTTHLPPYGYVSSGGTNHKFFNNTIIGSSTSQAVANVCFYLGTGSAWTLENNTCQNVGLFISTPAGTGGGRITLSDFNNWYNGGGFYTGSFLSYANWQALGFDANSTPANPNIQTTIPFQPNTVSPIINVAANLTSLGLTPLDADFISPLFGAGSARPGGVTLWTMGAVNSPGAIAVPGAPGSLAASVSGSTANLTWTVASGTVSGYTVKRATINGGPYTQIATNISSLSYADTNLAAGTYYYVVNAFNASGAGTNSNQASATIQPVIQVPAAPASLTASVGGSTVTLNWAASLGTPTNYIVKRGTAPGGPYSTIATLGLVLTYQDLSLANGTYYYVVDASNSAGVSGHSPQATAIVATAPALKFLPSSSLSAGSLVWGQSGCGISGLCTVTVNSTGTANLTLAGSNAVTISGPNAADFSVSSTTCTNGLVITPNNSCSITISFTPSLVGAETASLVVVSNDPSSPDVVALSGTGTAPTAVNPTSVNFGNVFNKKTSSSQIVTFSNLSSVTINFSSIAITGGDSSQFSKTADTCGASVAAGANCTVTITFVPTSTGTKSSTLVFTDDAASSPQNVSLTGTAKSHGILRVGAAVSWPAGGAQAINAVWRRPWSTQEFFQFDKL